MVNGKLVIRVAVIFFAAFAITTISSFAQQTYSAPGSLTSAVDEFDGFGPMDPFGDE